MEIYRELLLMSIATTAFIVLFKLLTMLTKKHFSMTWHYYTLLLLYTLFLIPYYKLLDLLNSQFFNNQEHITAPLHVLSVSSAMSDTVVAQPTAEQSINILIMIVQAIPFILFAGTCIVVLKILLQHINLRRFIRTICQPVTDNRIYEELTKSKHQLGVLKKVNVYYSPYVTTPFVYGYIKPRIVLPNLTFENDELQQVFLHELTHVKRHDILIQYFLNVIHALHWFNPIAFIAKREIDHYRELSCDEAIVGNMNEGDRKRYGRLLLQILWNVEDKKEKGYTAFGSNRKIFERRMNVIMKKNQPPKKKWARVTAIITTFTLALGGTTVLYAANNEAGHAVNDEIIGEDPVDPDSEIDDDEVTHSFSDNYFEEVQVEHNRLGAEDAEVSAYDEAVTEVEWQPSDVNGTLAAGEALTFEKQEIEAGSEVTITPQSEGFQVGLYAPKSGSVYYAEEDGESVTFQIESTANYAVYVGNPSDETVDFVVSYQSPNRSSS